MWLFSLFCLVALFSDTLQDLSNLVSKIIFLIYNSTNIYVRNVRSSCYYIVIVPHLLRMLYVIVRTTSMSHKFLDLYLEFLLMILLYSTHLYWARVRCSHILNCFFRFDIHQGLCWMTMLIEGYVVFCHFSINMLCYCYVCNGFVLF